MRQTVTRFRRLLVPASLAAFLAACGGGGQDASDTPERVPAAETQATASGGKARLDMDCLRAGGYRHESGAKARRLEDAEPVFVDRRAGVAIYDAGTPAGAQDAEGRARRAESKGNIGRFVYVADARDEDAVRACLKESVPDDVGEY